MDEITTTGLCPKCDAAIRIPWGADEAANRKASEDALAAHTATAHPPEVEPQLEPQLEPPRRIAFTLPPGEKPTPWPGHAPPS